VRPAVLQGSVQGEGLMSKRFGSFPTWWIRVDEKTGLKKFSGGASAGKSIAALKCIVALSVSIEFWTRKAKLSISDFEKLTGLSRPMVIHGLKKLQDMGIVLVDRSGHVHEYELTVTTQDDKWAKIPFERARRHISEIPNRGIVALTAIKIYLLLACIRPNDQDMVAISYDTFTEYLGVQRPHIRAALDILYSHTLIRITLEGTSSKERHNVYTVSGLF